VKTSRSRTVLAASLALALALTACSDDGDDGGSAESNTTAAAPTATTAAPDTTVSDGPTEPVTIEADIVGTALGAEVFTQLAGLVVDAGLVQALKAPGPLTVFAPTDDAFAAVPDATMDAVHADPDLLTAVLTYHVVEGEILASDLNDGDELTTLQGSTLAVSVRGDKIYVNDAEIVAPDVQATNGVIHVINSVLVPGG
jgi:uncharacterized surface protein with fasciclin (FAS1) repeats